MRYLSARAFLLAPAQKGWHAMRSVPVGSSARRHTSSLLVLPLIALMACQTVAPPPAVPAPRSAATASAGRLSAPSSATPKGQSSTSAAAPLHTLFEDSFEHWPNQPLAAAWPTDGAYRMFAREPGRFVTARAPVVEVPNDFVATANFHKVGGPPGGGYGLIVRNQAPEPGRGTTEPWRFIVFEASDQGQVGVWEREYDHWVAYVPWTASDAVRRDQASNELAVRAIDRQLTFLVNGIQVAQVDTAIRDGGAGVFVGGDLNEVVLERFLIQASEAEPIAATANHCPPGIRPRFTEELASLKARIWIAMGDALECAHPGSDSGDLLQTTSSGTAMYRAVTKTPVFTSGTQHWALTSRGLVHWLGIDIDPPANAQVVPLFNEPPTPTRCPGSCSRPLAPAARGSPRPQGLCAGTTWRTGQRSPWPWIAWRSSLHPSMGPGAHSAHAGGE